MRLSEFVENNMPKDFARPLPWHVKQICNVLERGMRERKNVILEVHPRSWKSEIVNMYRPAWWLKEGYFKNHFGLVCNSQMLADKFCQATRQLCDLPISLSRTSEWKVAADDSLDFTYKAQGISGSITGFGFDDITFDDLFKNGQEAKSEAKRNSIIDGVVSAGMNRLTPQGIVIAMQARLHPGDTIGWLLDTDMKFLRLHLPATNDDGDKAWFEDQYSGERVVFPAYSAMWPERFPRPVLEQTFSRITSYYRMAQYQQTPSLGELNFFDTSRWPRYDHPTGVDFSILAVDAGNTQTASGSYSAFVCLGVCDKHLKVLGVRRGRWRQDVLIDELWEFYRAMGRLTGRPPMKVIVERAAAGYGLIDHLSGKMPIEPLIPRGSKEERAESVCYLPNKGVVQLPTSGQWVRPFCEELDAFPLVSDKDQVDAFVHCLSLIARPGMFDLPDEPVSLVLDSATRDEDYANGLKMYGDHMENELAFEMVENPWPEQF